MTTSQSWFLASFCGEGTDSPAHTTAPLMPPINPRNMDALPVRMTWPAILFLGIFLEYWETSVHTKVCTLVLGPAILQEAETAKRS